MRLVDTSAWIEWFRDTATGQQVRKQVPDFDEWLVPTIVQHELVKWLLRNVDEAAAYETLALSNTGIVAPLTTTIAAAAAAISLTHKLSTADAIIYATAQHYGADLLTCDAHFEDLEGVIHIAKTA
jgi:predicted nucleic acid-binding protein